jgi:hypothetical protein
MGERQLLAALQEASGPSPELDRAIDDWLATIERRYGPRRQPFTASVDAALMLVEQMLPPLGSMPAFDKLVSFPNGWRAEIGHGLHKQTSHLASTAPLAILSALFAVLSQGGGNGG